MATTVWHGHLTFGLVSIPVRLFKAARSEKIRFRQLYRSTAARPAGPKPEALSARDIEAVSPARRGIAAVPPLMPLEQYSRVKQNLQIASEPMSAPDPSQRPMNYQTNRRFRNRSHERIS